MSRQYENNLAKRIHRVTPNVVKVYTCGYSGNNAFPQPDILVTAGYENHAIELKKTTSDRFYVEEDDIDQLVECTGGNTSAWLVVKFTNREPVCVKYMQGAFDGSDVQFSERDDVEKLQILTPEAFEPHVTDGGSLRLSRPSTDDWASSQSGRKDHVVLLSELGIANESSI